MPHPPHLPLAAFPARPARPARSLSRVLPLLALVVVALGPLALPLAAAGTLTMNARVLLQGHARDGSWTAVEVDLQNDGPPIRGELRMDGGAETRTRYAMAVDLPTGSHQVYVLHAQPPAFGRTVKVELVASDQVVESVTVAYLVHDRTQLIVGVVAERPQGLVSQIKLPASQSGTATAVVPLSVEDLPERVEGWSVLDRLVWQDVDSNRLSSDQLTSLRGWLAAGGRLVIVGGSAGIGTLSSFPDDVLPFRPTATLDLDPASLTSFLGPLPAEAADLPAMAGAPGPGRALVTSGDRVVAGELKYGSGRVTVLGFDPTTPWLAASKSVDPLWQGLLPQRTSDSGLLTDDSQLLQAVYQLPALALPPTFGLLLIIGAYILVIGPINYLVLRRLDRRELAWVTTPVLVLGFAGASFGYGSFLHGTDVVVNEVAIVRGAPDATEATAQVYFGVFSPTRSTYQVEVPRGALLAAPMSADPFSGDSGALDIIQGSGPERPSAVRNLTVGTGSLRIVRAQLPVTAPRMRATLSLADGFLTGTFENASDEPLEVVAVALGSSVAVLGDVAAHETRDVRIQIRSDPFGASLADRIVGQAFDSTTESGVRRSTRYAMLQQLTFDPMGRSAGQLPGDQAVILAFGRGELLDLKVGNEAPRRNGNVLYYVPVPIGIHGRVTFSSDLLQPTLVASDSQFVNKDRFFMSMGSGSATFAYRPIPFEGRLAPVEIRLSIGQEGTLVPSGGQAIEPLPSIPVVCTDSKNTSPEGCEAPRDDFMPEVEVFDRTGAGTWVRLPRMTAELSYKLTDPSRYVDPASGQILVRFVNDNPQSSVGFGFQLVLVGDVE